MPRRIITAVKPQDTFTGRRLKRYDVFCGDVVIAVIQFTGDDIALVSGHLEYDEASVAASMI